MIQEESLEIDSIAELFRENYRVIIKLIEGKNSTIHDLYHDIKEIDEKNVDFNKINELIDNLRDLGMPDYDLDTVIRALIATSGNVLDATSKYFEFVYQ